MGRYYTPGRCLDCQWIIGDLLRCSHCGLLQSGPEADRIRSLLTSADDSLRVQRGRSIPATGPSPAGSASPSPVGPPVPGGPAVLPPPLTDVSKAPALTTPAILLGLGAVCVLVAAVVFVSVAWTGLSLGVKAVIMLAVTGAIAWVAAWLMRRGLRGSAEALSIVATLLVALDLVAARRAGLAGLDTIGRNLAMWLVAAVVVVVGCAWARAALFTRARQLVGVQLLAVLGLWRMVMLTYDQHLTRTEYVAFAIVVAIAALAFAAARLAVWWFAVLALALSALNLLIAFGASFVRVAGEDTLSAIWSTGRAIGWVACMLVAWLVAMRARLPMGWRTAAASVLVGGVSFLLLRPIQGESYDMIVVVATLVFTAAAVASLVTRRPWRRGLRIGAIPVGLFAATLIGPSVMVAVGTALAPTTSAWSMSPTDRPSADIVLETGIGTWWVIGLSAFVLMLAVEIVLNRGVPRTAPILSMAIVATALAALRIPDLPLWAVVVILASLTGCAAVVALRHRASLVWLLAGTLAVLTLGAALGSDVLTVVVAGGIAGCLAWLAGRVAGRDEGILLALTATLLLGLGGLAAASWVGGVDAIESAGSYVLVASGAAVLLAAQVRPAGRHLPMRLGMEAGGGVLGVVGAAFATAFSASVQLPIALTLVGAALIAVSLVSDDRRLVAVAGGLVLMSASWVRLAAVGVTAVEAYTLPTGLVLLVLGAVRMVRRPGSSSIPVLLPGLALSLLPSLWVAVSEPTSLRALLLGTAATAVMLVGAYLRWIAPLLFGAAVILVLAGINLAPYAAAIPRWVLFGLLGAALLYLGVTWEKRLRNARTLIAAAERLA